MMFRLIQNEINDCIQLTICVAERAVAFLPIDYISTNIAPTGPNSNTKTPRQAPSRCISQ